MKKTILFSAVISFAALFLGFFAGTTYQKGKLAATRPGINQQGMVNGTRTVSANTGNRNGAPVSGKIIKLDATSITIQTSDGSNKIVLISDSTKVNKTTQASKADLKEGDEVMVIGTTDSTTGSISAQTVNMGTNYMGNQGGNGVGNQPSVTK
ncbi:MAG TPA: hypothetical protein PLI45_01255 [Candidatus Woesebacteria bacterium]|nr:hypothetical protein [Candidatus Woesebacteria bacterium]